MRTHARRARLASAGLPSGRLSSLSALPEKPRLAAVCSAGAAGSLQAQRRRGSGKRFEGFT